MKICQNCQKEFPIRMEIDGKIRNLNNRKNCINCSPFGLHNTKQMNKKIYIKLKKICPICNIEYENSEKYFYKRSKRTDLSNECRRCWSKATAKRITNQRHTTKKELILQKGGKCELCNYNKSIWAMHFHHLDPAKKYFFISRITSKKILEKEIKKCILVCSNCHREIHAGFHPNVLNVTFKASNSTIQRRTIKKMGIDILGGECKYCKYKKCDRALDFHHINPNEKEFSFHQINKNLIALKKELNKCILLCSNCHTELHQNEN